MYVIVVGGGRIGSNLTKLLLSEKHEVLLVEKEPARYQKLKDDFGESVILGDGAELGTLMDMGVNRADVLVAVTGADQDNLIICQLAKVLYLIPRTIALVNDPKNEELFRNLGVDSVVSSTSIIGALIEEKIDAGMVIPLLALKGGDMEIFQTELPSDSPLVGKKILRKGTNFRNSQLRRRSSMSNILVFMSYTCFSQIPGCITSKCITLEDMNMRRIVGIN